MLLLEMFLALGLSGLLTATTYRRLMHGAFSRLWLAVYFVLICLGVVVGIQLLSIRHLISPTARVYGFPFVIAGGDFIDGHWKDGGIGDYMPFAALADIALGITLCTLPVAVASLLRKGCVQKGSESVA